MLFLKENSINNATNREYFSSFKKKVMKAILKPVLWMLLFGMLSCLNDESILLHLDSVKSDKFYQEEIIPAEYLGIYGKWKLYDISGGIHGGGYEPDYDFLEIKSSGIYGLVRNDNLFEYGKIELDTFDSNTTGFLQVKFVPEYFEGQNPNSYPPEKYISLKKDSLNLISPCCDMYNYHYVRVR